MEILKRQIEFELGEVVYLVTDGETARVVTAYYVTSGDVQYELSYLGTQSTHYAFEISADKIYS